VQKAQATASFPVTTTKDQVHQKTKSMVKIISSSAIVYSGAHIPSCPLNPTETTKSTTPEQAETLVLTTAAGYSIH
jgi:hypothetical protein